MYGKCMWREKIASSDQRRLKQIINLYKEYIVKKIADNKIISRKFIKYKK